MARLAEDRLRIHERRARVSPSRVGIRFLGYRVRPGYRLIRKENVRQLRRRVRWMKRAYAAGRIGWGEIEPRLVSWIGHARRADSCVLLRRLAKEWVFRRQAAAE